jgi:hypothetical protein
VTACAGGGAGVRLRAEASVEGTLDDAHSEPLRSSSPRTASGSTREIPVDGGHMYHGGTKSIVDALAQADAYDRPRPPCT